MRVHWSVSVLSLLFLSSISRPVQAQLEESLADLIGERAALQDAVCSQDWADAIEATDQLLELDEVPVEYRDDLAAFRDQLTLYQETEAQFATIPNCDSSSETIPGNDQAFVDRLAEISSSVTSPLTQDIIEEMGSNNFQVAKEMCLMLSDPEIDTPSGLLLEAVERNFFGLPVSEFDSLDEVIEGNAEQQSALVEYLSFMAVIGASQFCEENQSKIETMFGVSLSPESPTP